MAQFPAGITYRKRISGVRHWRWQRLSAVLLLGLMAYFVVIVATVGKLDHAAAVAFVATPLNAIALTLLVVVGLFHAALGLEVVIEDYVAVENGRHGLIFIVKAALGFVGIACLWSLFVTVI